MNQTEPIGFKPTRICGICGADDGLHKFETMNCPKDGREEYRDGYKQIWMDTTFIDSSITKLNSASKSMAIALQEIQRKVSGASSLEWKDILYINGTCLEALKQAGL